MIMTKDKPDAEMGPRRLSHGELLELRRWNTPTIYNGWEQVTKCDAGRDGFNLEETVDFMPQMGAMVGHAVTVVCEPGNPAHRKNNPDGWNEYRSYLASVPGPKIVALRSLGHIGDRGIVPDLKAALHDQNEAVRATAAGALLHVLQPVKGATGARLQPVDIAR